MTAGLVMQGKKVREIYSFYFVAAEDVVALVALYSVTCLYLHMVICQIRDIPREMYDASEECFPVPCLGPGLILQKR